MVEPAGCLHCRDTGYKGRSGIYEIMPFTEGMHAFADEAGSLPKLRKQAYKEGMCSLRLSGARKVATGMTSLLEVLRVAPDAD
jgi:general secretion pathway protein E